jgi:HlyD family secretion protein
MRTWWVVAIAITASLLLVGIIWWLASREHAVAALSISGTVEATEAHVGAPTGGQLEVLLVREGQAVAPAQELARLDRSQALAERREAQAAVVAAQAELASLEAGTRREEIAQARAALRGAQARQAQADRDLRITRGLHERGTVTRAELDKDRLAASTAGNEVAQAREQLALLREGPRQEAIAAQRARVEQAEARVAALDAALDTMIVKAPFAGVVTMTHRERGETVPPGAAVVTIMDPRDRWVRTYVSGDRIGEVSLGAPADIQSDSYPDHPYKGEVVFIASEAEFTPKTVQTQEERVTLVYAIKVRILGDEAQELKPGMPVDVIIELQRGAVAARRGGAL